MHTRRIYLFIGFYIALVLAMGYAARDLRFDGSLESLLPHDNPHVLAFEQLKQLRSSEGGIDVILKITPDSLDSIRESISQTSELNPLDPDSLIQQFLVQKAADFERTLNKAILEEGLLVSTIEWKRDLHLLQPSIMYLMTNEELDGVSLSISEAIQSKKEEANPFYFSVDQDSINQKNPSELIAEFTQESMLLDYINNAEIYELSTKEGTLRMSFLLSFTLDEFDALKSTIEKLELLGAEWQQDNPTMELFWGGNYVHHFNRFNNVTRAVSSALWIGLIALFGFLWAYMRKVGRGSDLRSAEILKDMALMIGILLSGVVITLGLYSAISAMLNLFVVIIFTVLIGMNLDYLLHMYALARRGQPVNWRSTAAIRYSALTTTLAISTLLFAQMDGFVQLGTVVVINVPIHFLSSLLFLPMSAAVRKHGMRSQDDAQVDAQDHEQNHVHEQNQVPYLSNTRFFWWGTAIFLVLLVGSGFGLQRVVFNTDFTSLEPQDMRSEYRHLSRSLEPSDSRFEPSFVLAPDLASTKKMFLEMRERLQAENRGEDLPDIAQVESLAGRLMADSLETANKTQKIEEIQALIQKNKEFTAQLDQTILRYIQWAEQATPATLQNMPEYLKNRFYLRNGELAPLLLVYSKTSLSSGEVSMRYLTSSGVLRASDGQEFVAASTQLIAASVLERLMSDTQFLTIVPFGMLFLIVLLLYRNVGYTLLALSPLVVTFMVLLAINSFWNIPLHVYNVVILPIVIGVSIDNGIHLVHSIRAHGQKFARPFVQQTYPVLVSCSFTTVLGFVGLLFVNHPGLVDMGGLAIGAITISVLVTLAVAFWWNSWLMRE
ncbi:MMPL family transporter [Bacteroidota bacterium]|nr:MMPL family transporter [Bacteroidota bacterium]